MSNYIVHHSGMRVAVGDTLASTQAWVAEQATPSEYTVYKYIGGLPSSPNSWKLIPA